MGKQWIIYKTKPTIAKEKFRVICMKVLGQCENLWNYEEKEGICLMDLWVYLQEEQHKQEQLAMETRRCSPKD